MNKRIVLSAPSTGDRGAKGHRKVYEVIVTGATLTTRWGRAERPAAQQTRVQKFVSNASAVQAADLVVAQKLGRYRIESIYS